MTVSALYSPQCSRGRPIKYFSCVCLFLFPGSGKCRHDVTDRAGAEADGTLLHFVYMYAPSKGQGSAYHSQLVSPAEDRTVVLLCGFLFVCFFYCSEGQGWKRER